MRCNALVPTIAIAGVCYFSPTLGLSSEAKCVATYAPRPGYPSLPNGRRPEGKGVFVCHIDAKTGRVTSVSIAKSTGSELLDKACVDCCKRWKFEPDTCAREVKIPFEFTTHGLPTI